MSLIRTCQELVVRDPASRRSGEMSKSIDLSASEGSRMSGTDNPARRDVLVSGLDRTVGTGERYLLRVRGAGRVPKDVAGTEGA